MAAPIALAFRIAANLNELKANLSDLKGQLETTKKAMQTMTSAFDGSRIIADANAAVKAVADIGGATALTTKEQQRLNALVTEAIAKYEALGKEAPDALHAMQAQTNQVAQTVQQAAKETEGAAKTTQSWTEQIKGFGAALGIAFSVGAVVQFAKSVFESASKIGDLASQLGVSTDAVQGFQFAAEQSGSTLDAVGIAIGKMNANLAGGDKATVKALNDAGLGFSEIRSMKPEDAFLAIADAIQKIDDPMKQVEVGRKLMGKGFDELLPAIKEGFRSTAASANKMSEDTVKSLKAAQDAWTELGRNITVASGTVIAKSMSAFESATTGVTKFLLAADAWWSGSSEKLGLYKLALNGIPPAADGAGAGIAKVGGAAHQTQEQIDAAAAAAKKWADELSASFRKWSGADIAEQAKVLDITFRKMADSGQITEQQLRAMATEAAKLAEQGAVLSPRLWDIVMATGALDPPLVKGTKGITDLGNSVELQIPKLSAFNEAVLAMNATLGKADASLTAFTSIGERLPAMTLPKAPIGMFESLFGTPKEMGAYVSSSIMSAVQGGGDVVAAAGGAIGQQLGTNIAKKLSKSLTDAGSGLFSQALGGIFEAVLPGVGALLGPLASKLWDGLKSVFDRDKGRDLVKDFADSLGGFDAPGGLHAQLLAVGEAGEAMWIRLTQQVGRNDQEGARAAIAAATELLKKHKDEVTAGAAAQEAAAASIAASNAAAIQSAQQAIKDLDGQIASLNQSIANEAPEEEMGVIEKNTRAQIASLEAQRKEASKSLEALTAQAADSMQNVADAIKDLPDEIAVKLRVELETHTRGGDSGGAVPMAAGGDFLVTRPTLFLVGEAGPERATFSGAGKTSHPSSGMDSRLLGEIKQLLRDQPRAMAIAIQDAMALGGAR